jgi:hypothetical protein
MSPDLAAADRLVINTARAFERAAQYGINTMPAARDYDTARAKQTAARRQATIPNQRRAAA